MLTTELRNLPPNRAIVLRNKVCAYCGGELTSGNTTKEHVVGRRFVPKGKLDGHWNLILNACEACNGRKSGLEDDVSAISLFPDLMDDPSEQDQAVVEEARRKAARSFSRRTRKAVKDSHEHLAFDVPFAPGAKLGFSFTSPPQIDEDRAFDLARLQLAGFFFFITYQQQQERGYWWTGGFHPLMMARRGDWGNTIMVDFAKAVLGWEPRCLGHTADGYFGVCIRRHPGAECWSWALEWNGSIRLIGFLGDREAAQAVVDQLGSLRMSHQDLGGNSFIRFREEVPLDPQDDVLFSSPLREA